MRLQIKTATDISVEASLEKLDLLLVCSHERSGTHFLMNSLAENTGYTTDPYLDFDLLLSGALVNFYDLASIERFVKKLSDLSGPDGKRCFVTSIIKSHHQAEMMRPCFDLPNVTIAYICRHPLEVMISFWNFLSALPWHEGPKKNSLTDFVSAAPEGRLMRYQQASLRDMITRWAVHVESWLAASEAHKNIKIFRYDELLTEPEQIIKSFGQQLGIPTNAVYRAPDRNNYIGASSANTKPSEADIEHAYQYIKSSLRPYVHARKLLGSL